LVVVARYKNRANHDVQGLYRVKSLLKTVLLYFSR
jgi:hypothetical protein